MSRLSYRNLRENIGKYSAWNLYAGTRYFSTDSFLSFKNSSLNEKYIAENRSIYSICILIGVSLISYIGSELIYDIHNFGILFILSAGMMVAAGYVVRKYKGYRLCRLCMQIPFLAMHFKYLVVLYNTPTLLALIPILVYDLLTLSTWKLHAISLASHI